MYIEVRKRPLDGELYAALLRALATLATTIGMIIRSDKVTLTPRAAGLLAALEPYLIRIEQVEEWPGTRLVGGRTSLRYLYRLTPSSLNLALEASNDIFEWVNPNLPEDIHFLRQDGSTVLGSIAQEDAVWLDIGDDELQLLLVGASSGIRDALTQ